MESLNRSERAKFQGSGGLERYLKFLEDTIMDLPIPGLANRFTEYFYGFKCENGETMKMYDTKARTTIDKLERALAKV